VPASSDEFDGGRLGLQWQWQANPDASWWSLSEAEGVLRLAAQPLPEGASNLWPVPSLLMQKPPAETFQVTTEMRFAPTRIGERAGLLVFGTDYAWIGVEQTPDGPFVLYKDCLDAREGGEERELGRLPATDGPLQLRVEWSADGRCRFSASTDGGSFTTFDGSFSARPGRWVGARVGVFAAAPTGGNAGSPADFAWFRVAPLDP